MKRRITAELLDSDQGTPHEVTSSLNDLRHINQWFGGVGTTAAGLRRVARESRTTVLSVLEVGAGAGDVVLGARQRLEGEGIRLRLTMLDQIARHLPGNGTSSVAANALALPFRDNAFDVVSCCLLAHHFEPPELRALVAEALRVGSRAVLINDLIRSSLHLALVYFGLPLFRSPITWHDAPASVRRAYTVDEMSQVLRNLGARDVEITRRYLYRMAVLVWK